MNKNHNEEVPDFLGEFLRPDGSKRLEVERGDMLPADVPKKLNELKEQLHHADKYHQGCPVFVYASGSQYMDNQFNFGKTLPNLKSELYFICFITKGFKTVWI